ncbi:MAG: alpha-E domain-containing protein [Verrucomicrobiota bacterium]
MLSRDANSLLWMARYIERAENLARLVEVNRIFFLDSRKGEGSGEDEMWRPVMQLPAMADAYAKATEAQGGVAPDLGYFVTMDSSNAYSIRACIAQARENARMVRDQISEEMWLELNTIHLFLKSDDAEMIWGRSPEAYLRRLLEFSLLFQGLTDATVPHNEGWRFVQLGKFLERADKTSRILDSIGFMRDEGRGKCLAVLRCCSAVSAFRDEFGSSVTLDNVTAFLLFSQAFPRSIRFCLRKLDEVLHDISGVGRGEYSNEAERLTGGALANLNFSGIADVKRRGLNEYVDDIQVQLNDIGQEIFESYVLLPSAIRSLSIGPVSVPLQFQMQQQQQQQ